MNDTTLTCKQCGAVMTQEGSERQKVRYHCHCCGRTEYVDIGKDDNDTYWQLRSELLSRVRVGLFDWQITNWQYLRRDIQDFIGRYEEARDDIYLKISIVACITDGFHDMNKEEYREAKAIFRVTEKVYKDAMKQRKLNPTAPISENYLNYEEYRTMFKQCRYDYRSRKIYWKIVFFLLKRLIPR